MLLLIDNYDSFTYNLVHYLGELGADVRVVRIREDLRLGHRVNDFVIESHSDSGWAVIAQGAGIGACRLVRLQKPVNTRAIRLRFNNPSAQPAIAEFSAYS